jgi:hypothetical protein
MNIDGPRQPGSSSWNRHPDVALSEESQPLGVPQFGDQAQVPYTYSHESSAAQLPQDSNTNTNDFLFPIPPRLRSKSDTALQSPQWDTNDFMAQEHVSNRESSALDDNIGTVNLNDVHGPTPNAFVNVPPNMNLFASLQLWPTRSIQSLYLHL